MYWSSAQCLSANKKHNPSPRGRGEEGDRKSPCYVSLGDIMLEALPKSTTRPTESEKMSEFDFSSSDISSERRRSRTLIHIPFDVLKAGWLWKMSSHPGRTTSNSRYFVLTKSSLEYFRNERCVSQNIYILYCLFFFSFSFLAPCSINLIIIINLVFGWISPYGVLVTVLSEMPPHRNEVSFSQTTAVCQEMFIRFPRVFPLTLLLSYIVPIF